MDLLTLITDTKKQLEHLRILGVEGIRGTDAVAPAVQIQPPAPAPRPQPVIEKAPSSTTLFGEIAAPALKLEPSTETFEQIHAEIGDCTRCPLHQERTRVVH